MTNKKLCEQMKEINLPKGEYVIFGAGPLCIRGLRECSDLDVVVTKELFDKLKSEEGWAPSKAESGSEALKKGDIEVFKDWPGFDDINKLVKDAEIIEDLPFVKLDNVVFWKKMMGREKDLDDMEIINKYFRDACAK